MNKFKQVISKYKKAIACSLIGICSLVAVPTLAVIVNSGAESQSFIVTQDGHKYITSHKFDQYGNIAYCLESDKDHPNNHDYQESGTVEDALFRILKFGYPNHNYTNDANADYFITQLAVWAYKGQIDIDRARITVDRNIQANGNRYTVTGSTYKGPLTSDYVKASIKDLVQQARSNQDPQTGSVTVSPKTNTAKQEGDYLISSDYTVTGTGTAVNNTGALQLTASRDIPGLKIIKDGKYSNINEVSLKIGDRFKVAIPKYTPTGSVKFKIGGTISAKKAVFHESNSDKVQDVVIYKPVVVDAMVNDVMSLNWEKAHVLGTVRVRKIDTDTRKTLEGAEFGLYQGDKKILSATVNKTGTAIFEKVPHGKYTLKEDKPPINYHKTDKTWEVDIVDGTQDVSLDFEVPNKQIVNKIQVTKRDNETKEALTGAEFELSQNNKPIATQAVDESGVTTFENLKAGTYQLKETKAPVGYELETEVKTITIKDSYQVQTIKYDFLNEKKQHKVNIYKFDQETEKPLAGAKFRILTKDGNPYYWNLEKYPQIINQRILDVLNNAYSNLDIPSLAEIKNKLQGFDKVPNEEVETLADKETKPDYIIDMKVLSDEEASTEVIPLEDNYVIEKGYSSIIETDAEGKVTIPGTLPYGEYKIVEVAPPSGYAKLEEPLTFVIDDENSTEPVEGVREIQIDVANTRGEGELEITKTDVSTGELLPNAKFVIYEEDGETVVVKGQTDDKGIAKFKLKTGKYYYQEYEAPAGYMIDNSLFPFEIKEDGDIVKCQMTNTKIPKTGTNPINPLPIVIALGVVVLGSAFVISSRKNKKE